MYQLTQTLDTNIHPWTAVGYTGGGGSAAFYNRLIYKLVSILSSTANSSASTLLLIARDMAEVDKVISTKLGSDVPLVSQVCEYIISAGGKRLRPALLLLLSNALGYTHPHRHTLAAVVEFIHTATLLHDDVVDESTLRRGRDTANQLFGNAASVLVGDFLYSRAFQMMVEVGQMRVMEILAEATNTIAEGEVLQLMNMHDANLTEDDYLKVIRSKTAKLFEASARLAPVMANAGSDMENICARYGQALGTAFQVIDDILDYEGDAAVLGKNLGDDLREGKVTLPIIFALQRTQGRDRTLLVNAIENASDNNLPEVLSIIQTSGALEDAKHSAWQEANRAVEAAKELPVNTYSSALIALAASLQHRET